MRLLHSVSTPNLDRELKSVLLNFVKILAAEHLPEQLPLDHPASRIISRNSYVICIERLCWFRASLDSETEDSNGGRKRPRSDEEHDLAPAPKRPSELQSQVCHFDDEPYTSLDKD